MLKFLQKSLPVLAIAGAGFVANAQEINENFQSWTETNVKMNTGTPTGVTTANEADGTCDPITITGTTNTPGHGVDGSVTAVNPIKKTVTYGALPPVEYTITNGAIVPNCKPKIAYGTSTSPAGDTTVGVTHGYVELNKFPTGSPAGTVGGSFVTSAFSYVEEFDFTTSGTSSARVFKVFTSTDGGTNWVADANQYSAGKLGDVYALTVQKLNVMFKIESYDQIIRIHDFMVYTAPLGIAPEAWYSLGGKVRVEGNNALVSSSYNGTVEILNTNGIVVSQNYIVAGAESSLSIPSTGMYIVRLTTASKTATKKIVVQ